MTHDEIKKYLYRNPVEASFMFARDEVLFYQAPIEGEPKINVIFEIPAKDTKGASFMPKMKAKHLIKWLPK